MSASTCAISSLPYELLTESTTFKAEWTLSHVSHRFRDVVVGEPALWTLIETDFTGEGSVEILNLYLERSRTSKISLILREPESCMAVDGLLRERVTEIIVPQQPLIWNTLEIVYRSDEFVAAAPVAVFWSGAPRLTFLKIVRSTLQLSPQPSWMASITHLELLGYYDPDIYSTAVMAQCPSLTHLHLEVPYAPPDANRFHIPTLNSSTFRFKTTSVQTTSPRVTLSPTLFTPRSLFPALSHLILINQCHAYSLIKDLLGPVSHPWPLLKTITLGAVDDSFEEVGAAVEDAVDSKRQRGERVPEVRLFRVLSSLEDWDENSPVDVERSWPNDTPDAGDKKSWGGSVILLCGTVENVPSLTHLHLDVTYAPGRKPRADYLSYIVALFDAPALENQPTVNIHRRLPVFVLLFVLVLFPLIADALFLRRGVYGR
ncbi:hypothetical protein B0H14DRAFT_3469963 [Mycena olivaceomarginata]|nr:hypothetical protein B0H14DRAFT_3469963 [Mycena olivaceomarginata]